MQSLYNCIVIFLYGTIYSALIQVSTIFSTVLKIIIVFQSILKNLPELRHLNVSSCNNITDGAFLLDKDQHRRRNHTTVEITF